MEDYKVSVITCLYNVSRFLPEGLSSLINQTYKNLEILVIDDGSTDDSFFICEQLAKNDSRIKLFKKENGGLGSARNFGLDHATGDFICFYDVDDSAELNMIETCVHEMVNNVDLLIFSMNVYDQNTKKNDYMPLKRILLKNQRDLRNAFLDEILFIKFGNGYCCNKCYRRSFIEKYKIRFEDQRIQQDEVFNLKIYQKVGTVSIIPNRLYNYVIYKIGNTRSRFIPNRFEIYKSIYNHFLTIKKEWGINDNRFEDFLMKRIYSSVVQCLLFNMFHSDCKWNKKEKKAEIDRIMTDSQVLEALDYIQTTKPNIEQRLYLLAFKQKSLFLIRLYRNIFLLLRNIKSRI